MRVRSSAELSHTSAMKPRAANKAAIAGPSRPTGARISTRSSSGLLSTMGLHDLFFAAAKHGGTREYALEVCQRLPNTDALTCLKRKFPNGLLVVTATLLNHG